MGSHEIVWSIGLSNYVIHVSLSYLLWLHCVCVLYTFCSPIFILWLLHATVQLSSKVMFACVPNALLTHLRYVKHAFWTHPTVLWKHPASVKKGVAVYQVLLQLYRVLLCLHGCILCAFQTRLTCILDVSRAHLMRILDTSCTEGSFSVNEINEILKYFLWEYIFPHFYTFRNKLHLSRNISLHFWPFE